MYQSFIPTPVCKYIDSLLLKSCSLQNIKNVLFFISEMKCII